MFNYLHDFDNPLFTRFWKPIIYTILITHYLHDFDNPLFTRFYWFTVQDSYLKTTFKIKNHPIYVTFHK